jgi:hypothetical protein
MMCVPSMGIWYRRYHIILEGASLPSADGLVKPVSKPQCQPRFFSGLVFRKECSEESGTTKSGTDQQERHTEAR